MLNPRREQRCCKSSVEVEGTVDRCSRPACGKGIGRAWALSTTRTTQYLDTKATFPVTKPEIAPVYPKQSRAECVDTYLRRVTMQGRTLSVLTTGAPPVVREALLISPAGSEHYIQVLRDV